MGYVALYRTKLKLEVTSHEYDQFDPLLYTDQ